MPPSPALSARMMTARYLTLTTIASDQKISESRPSIVAVITGLITRRAERFLERVQRTRADVTEHDADGADECGSESLLILHKEGAHSTDAQRAGRDFSGRLARMPAELHETSLIAMLAIGFVLALLFGLMASALKVSPIVGYLLAGIAVGPFTPGFVADAGIASQLAEIGVILLMFGVGLHFSIKDLLSVRAIALPGAVAQILTATAIGAGMAHMMGWTFGQGLVFGLSLSVASTVVLLRALEERNALQSSEGKIAVGWLIVEDLAMVLALVLLPALAEPLGGTAATSTHRRAPRTHGSRCSSRWPRLRYSWRSRWSSARASCRGCSSASRAPARANCSRCACSRSRSASRTARRPRSACRSRSARSSPASSSRNRSSATRRAMTRCRSRMRSRCCSSSRWACCSIRACCVREPFAVLAVLAIIMVGKSRRGIRHRARCSGIPCAPR